MAAFRFLCCLLLAGAAGMTMGRAAVELPPVETIKSPTPACVRHNEVVQETERLAKAHDRDGLEALARKLRESRERFDSGLWLLTSFYDTASDLPEDDVGAEARLKFFREWAREKPESMTAAVCLAEALCRAAWQASDNDELSDEEQGRLYDTLMQEAWDVLERARALPEKCPGWYAAAQSVALGQEWERERYLKLINEAVEREPTYGEYYTGAAYFFSPTWNGEEGALERWFDQLLKRYPKEQRDRTYAFFAWMANRIRYDDEIAFGPGRLDWDRTKEGFEQWVAEEPENLVVRTQFIQLALLADDRMAVQGQFDVIGGRYWPAGWRDIDAFRSARLYAYRDAENPVVETRVEEPPPSRTKYSVEALDRARLVIRVLAGFAGGTIAGALLFVMARRREETTAGLAALGGAIVLGTIFGTPASMAAALGLFVYLRRHPKVWPPEITPPSGWMILLWVVVLSGAYLGLSCLAMIPPMIPAMLQYGHSDAMAQMVRDGTMLRLTFSAGWLTLLGMFALCPPGPRGAWQARFGLLRPGRSLPAAGWTVLAVALSLGAGLLASHFMDERSRESLEMIALGIASPVSFYITIAVMAPIFEELLFRGYAYSGWIGKLGFWGTALASSALFAINHVQYGLAGLIFVFVFGIILSGLRRLTGSIYPCIAVHFINNLAHCLMVQWGLGGL